MSSSNSFFERRAAFHSSHGLAARQELAIMPGDGCGRERSVLEIGIAIMDGHRADEICGH